MVNIECLSPVGIGTYRMAANNEIHFEALKTAVESGYNLIDTATSYCGGKSEELIGNFIKQFPEYSNKLFIISKVGYLPAQKLETLEFANYRRATQMEIAQIDIAQIDIDFAYSLDCNFIEFQLECSLEKINRDYLDVYLLHNPERFFQSKNLNSPTDLYKAITQAFQFLEEKVDEGKIRYYGISSNCLFDPSQKQTINFQRLLDIAQTIKEKHHFKFVQFPFNFKEQAALQKNYQHQSLLELAARHGLITIGNRPLNMNENGLEFRLVTHEKLLEAWDKSTAQDCLEHFLQVVDSKLKTVTNGENAINDFEPMVLLQKHYTSFQAREAVDAFFYQQILPFLETVFEKDFTSIDVLMQAVKRNAHFHALNNQTNRTNLFLDQLREESIPIKENSVLTACNAYLHEFNLDHVLVGLRSSAYVAALKNTFTQ